MSISDLDQHEFQRFCLYHGAAAIIQSIFSLLPLKFHFYLTLCITIDLIDDKIIFLSSGWRSRKTTTVVVADELRLARVFKRIILYCAIKQNYYELKSSEMP